MHNVDQRDFLGGIILSIAGFAVAFYAFTELPIGTVRQMGPGMFPSALGLLLAAIGILIALFALSRTERLPNIELHSAVAVLAGLSGFTLTVDRYGLIVAIAVLTTLTSFASQKLRPKHVCILIIFLSLLAWAIFVLGFGMPIQLWEWPH